jgi:hypothetical protein
LPNVRDILQAEDRLLFGGCLRLCVSFSTNSRKRNPVMKLLLSAFAIAACAATTALAQDQTPQAPPQGGRAGFMQACGGDMKNYCASAQSRDDRRSCMMANKDKFSDSCKAFMASHPMHQHPQGQMQGQPPGQPQ